MIHFTTSVPSTVYRSLLESHLYFTCEQRISRRVQTDQQTAGEQEFWCCECTMNSLKHELSFTQVYYKISGCL